MLSVLHTNIVAWILSYTICRAPTRHFHVVVRVLCFSEKSYKTQTVLLLLDFCSPLQTAVINGPHYCGALV